MSQSKQSPEQNPASDTDTITARPTYTVGQLAVMRAEQRGIDPARAAKEVRGILRANFQTITKLDPSILQVKQVANDGVRWPSLNDDVRAFVLDRTMRVALTTKANGNNK